MKNVSISEEDRKRVAEMLNGVLADSYRLALKTQNFHWNVSGPQFKALHDLFEEQYGDLAEAVDDLAERVRALGFAAPGGFNVFERLSVIEDAPEEPGTANEMLRGLAEDNTMLEGRARAALEVAEGVGDEATADMLIARMTAHDKAAWMLRASL